MLPKASLGSRETQCFWEDKKHIREGRKLSNMFTSSCIIFSSSTDYGFLVHSITNSCWWRGWGVGVPGGGWPSWKPNLDQYGWPWAGLQTGILDWEWVLTDNWGVSAAPWFIYSNSKVKVLMSGFTFWETCVFALLHEEWCISRLCSVRSYSKQLISIVWKSG